MKGCLRVCMLSWFSHIWLYTTLRTVACQAPLPLGFSRQGYWSRSPSSRGPSQLRDQTHVSDISCIGRQVLYHPGSPNERLGIFLRFLIQNCLTALQKDCTNLHSFHSGDEKCWPYQIMGVVTFQTLVTLISF